MPKILLTDEEKWELRMQMDRAIREIEAQIYDHGASEKWDLAAMVAWLNRNRPEPLPPAPPISGTMKAALDEMVRSYVVSKLAAGQIAEGIISPIQNEQEEQFWQKQFPVVFAAFAGRGDIFRDDIGALSRLYTDIALDEFRNRHSIRPPVDAQSDDVLTTIEIDRDSTDAANRDKAVPPEAKKD